MEPDGRDPRRVLDAPARAALCRLVARGAAAPPLRLRVPRRALARCGAGHLAAAAGRRLRRRGAAPPAQLPQVRPTLGRAGGLTVALARARQASRPRDAPPRLDVLPLRRAAFRDGVHTRLRRGRRDLDGRLRQDEPPAAEAAPERRRAAGHERAVGRGAPRRGACSRRLRPARRRLRRLLRAACARRPHRQPVRAVLADAVAARAHGRLARAARRPGAADRPPRGAQVGGTRQARPGEPQRARALARARRARNLAQAVLLAARQPLIWTSASRPASVTHVEPPPVATPVNSLAPSGGRCESAAGVVRKTPAVFVARQPLPSAAPLDGWRPDP